MQAPDIDIGMPSLGEQVTDLVEEKPNRMARRRRETRAKLLAATHQLVVEQGVEKTTMTNITELADLGRRTFYYHFSGKDECITASAADVFQRHALSAMKFVALDKDPAVVVATSTQLVIRALLKEPITGCLTEYPRLLGDALYAAIGEFVHRDMGAGIDAGRFHPPMKENYLDSMMIWSLTGLIIESLENSQPIDDVLKEYAQLVLMILGIPREEAQTIAHKAYLKLQTVERHTSSNPA